VTPCSLPTETTELTIECRIKVLVPVAEPVRIVSQWSEQPGEKRARPYGTTPQHREAPTEQNDQGSFYLGLARSGQIAVGFRTAQGSEHIVTGSGLKPDNNWHHLAAVWNRGAVLLFLDGKKAGTQAFPNAAQLARSKLPLVIGHASGKDANTVFFEGFISDVAVWNSARDASAISQNASQRLTGTEAGLVVWYALREEKPAAAVSGLPRGVPDGQLTGALARTGWYETPSWDDPKPDRPWIHFFRYDLSGAV
jgi:hypothetical protein